MSELNLNPPWSRRIPFKVDVAGVIHIMGAALYSRPEAAIRELIQNAHDAIMRRRLTDLRYQGRIDLRQDREKNTLSVHDDGIGLSADEAEQYLGTLGIGFSGLLKGEHPSSKLPRSNPGLIGQFGIGLFSAFMLADEIDVLSRRADQPYGVRWRAGSGTDIELSSCDCEHLGTTVYLRLKPDCAHFAAESVVLERIIKDYADYLPIPIFVNAGQTRVNVIHSEWFDPTPEHESLELAIASHFEETPLDVIPIHHGDPIPISGALYVSPQRTPGFSGTAVVTATVLRMVISPRIQDLIPEWASFIRGVLEVPNCRPTASREDLVRNSDFQAVRSLLENRLFEHFEQLAVRDPARFESVLSWHRYMWAGAALTEPRLRALLSTTYRFSTSHGQLTFDQVLSKSHANSLFETEFNRVVWYNTDRRQERWVSSLFANHATPCVHAVRSFEESLLAAFVADAGESDNIGLRTASPGSPSFASSILDVRDLEDAPEEWSEFLSVTEAKIMCASFREDQPIMAFLNEKHELLRTFDDLRKQGTVPAAFQRLIDKHLVPQTGAKNEVLLNRNHRLVGRALQQKTNSPLASVLRLLVFQALNSAGASIPRNGQQTHAEDLDWIADALWGRRT